MLTRSEVTNWRTPITGGERRVPAIVLSMIRSAQWTASEMALAGRYQLARLVLSQFASRENRGGDRQTPFRLSSTGTGWAASASAFAQIRLAFKSNWWHHLRCSWLVVCCAVTRSWYFSVAFVGLRKPCCPLDGAGRLGANQDCTAH